MAKIPDKQSKVLAVGCIAEIIGPVNESGHQYNLHGAFSQNYIITIGCTINQDKIQYLIGLMDNGCDHLSGIR